MIGLHQVPFLRGAGRHTSALSLGIGIGVALGATLGSISGAGAPGVSALDISDVIVIPVAAALGSWVLLTLVDSFLHLFLRRVPFHQVTTDGEEGEDSQAQGCDDDDVVTPHAEVTRSPHD